MNTGICSPPNSRIALAGSGNTAVGRAAYPRIHLQDGLYLNSMLKQIIILRLYMYIIYLLYSLFLLHVGLVHFKQVI